MSRSIAMVFPGQGSQSVGMLATLAERFPLIEQTFGQASEVLGYDLWQKVQYGPAEALQQTECTQPALLVASVAIWRVWQQQRGPNPTLLAGHSLGEYSALVCAGALDFEQAVQLVQQRGQLMQAAVPNGQGAMLAVLGLTDEQVCAACSEAAQGEVVSPVNFNAPGQVVIAGIQSAVERAALLCKAAGAKRLFPLPVSIPAHCILMKPAAEQLALMLQKITINKPRYPVINNIDVRIESTPEAIKAALVRQLYSSVPWHQIIARMVALGVEVLFELGPGSVLTGLAKRTTTLLSALAINDPVVLLSQIRG